MKLQRPPRLILKYYLFRGATGMGFFWPIFTIFLLGRGLNFTQIALLNSMEALLVLFGEVPTGYVSDRIGRRNSLVISATLFVAQTIGFVFATAFWHFVVLWVLYALSQTFRSGAGEAWLYDLLEERLDESPYPRVKGRGGSINQWVTAGSMLVAGVLYELDPTLPFVVGAAVSGLGVLVLLTFPKTKQYTDEGDDEDSLGIREALPLIRTALTKPPLRSVVLYVALFAGTFRAADEFIQPITVNTLGYPEASLGPLYAGFSVAAAIAAYFASDIEELLTRQWAIALIPVAMAVLFVLPMAFPIVALPGFFVMRASSAVVGPIASGYINDYADSVGRATLISAISMVYALARVPLQPLGGAVADSYSPIAALAALGAIAIAGFTVIYFWEPPAVETVSSAAD
jgi:MFS family permease